jgi:predicted pyridoxine 5'-phosphate oxidase superfamily flavin-nucleotide-binding protein
LNDDHVFFADIHSPGTVGNLKLNPSVEINMVDIFTRRGYRLKGSAEVLSEGPSFDRMIATYGEAARKYKINHVVVVKVERILAVWSPAYDDGTTQEEITGKWIKYWGEIHPDRS